MNLSIVQQIQEVLEFLEPRIPFRPEVAMVLGSGLGSFVSELSEAVSFSYEEVPHFQQPSVDGHSGRIYFGKINGVPLVVMQGRWHLYEGHSMQSVVLPTRVMAALGAHTIILTNAAGGINLNFKTGDLMLIDDHINLMAKNPLTGKESPLLGPRFPDMSEAYCRECITLLDKTAKRLGITLRKGVYVGLSGPTYETPAEVRMLRVLGGDAVGMSTVPEAIAARHLGMRVVGISCITNMASGIEDRPLDHVDVQASAGKMVTHLKALLIDALADFSRAQAPTPSASLPLESTASL